MNTKIDFILKATAELLNNGFSVKLLKKDNLDGYGGWLDADEDSKELVVALDHHMGFEIFVHEYCHFLQWKHRRKFWDASSDYYDLLFDWISDKTLNPSDEDLDKSLYTILAIEHDCERQALTLMTLNPVEGFDHDKYIRAANAYLWSYHFNRKLRQKPESPIYTEKLLSSMSGEFNTKLDYYLDLNNITDSMKMAILEEYQTVV